MNNKPLIKGTQQKVKYQSRWENKGSKHWEFEVHVTDREYRLQNRFPLRTPSTETGFDWDVVGVKSTAHPVQSGRMSGIFGLNSIIKTCKHKRLMLRSIVGLFATRQLTYSIMPVASRFCLARRQCRPNRS